SLLTQLIYVILGVSKGVVLGRPFGVEPLARYPLPVVPTLACVLLLVMLICWNGAALAFFLDRFRIPVLSVFVALALAAAQWPQSDHYFDVFSQTRTPLSPKQAIEAGRTDFAVVVAVSGGGIQA